MGGGCALFRQSLQQGEVRVEVECSPCRWGWQRLHTMRCT